MDFVSAENGTETVEWGIMAGLVVVGVILVVIAIGAWLKDRIDTVKAELGA